MMPAPLQPGQLISPRTAIFAVYAGFGVCVGAWAGAIPVIMRASRVSSEDLGIGLMAFTIAYVVSMSQGSRLGPYLNNRLALLATLPATALATTSLLMSETSLWLYGSLILWGVVLGFLDLIMNTEGSAIEHDLRRPVFSAFHGAASAGMPVLAIISSYVSNEAGPAATAVIVSIYVAFAWVLTWKAIAPRPKMMPGGTHLKFSKKALPLILMGLASGLIIATETAAIMWSAKLLDEQAPSLAAISGLGAAFFGLCSAAVRFPGDAVRRFAGDMPVMLGSLLIAMAGFAGLGLSQGFLMSVVAFAIVGFGTALLIPCLFARAAAFVPQDRASGLSFVSLMAGLPRILAPWGFGWIAAGFSVSLAFGICALLLAVALAMIIALRRWEDR